MNPEDKPSAREQCAKNNEEFYIKAIQSLSQLEERARRAGCKLEIEFDITQGQSGDNDTFQEGGTFVATFVPNENFRHQVMWPSENYSINVHLNGVSEEDFQEYDKIAGDIDLTGSADIELKEEIVSALKEKHDGLLIDDTKVEVTQEMFDKVMGELNEIKESYENGIEKSNAMYAFDKAKIDPEAF